MNTSYSFQSADQNSRQERYNRARAQFANHSIEELSYTLGRYCGLSNVFLSVKEYGYVIPKEAIEELLFEKSFHQQLEDEIVTGE